MKALNFQELLTDIVDIARFAPSVHNTQPWLISSEEQSITINLNHEHVLKEGDPTGRQTTISMGIFAEALIIAASKYNFVEDGISFHTESFTIRFEEATKKNDDKTKLIRYLKSRCTDRSVYQKVKLSSEIVDKIREADHTRGLSVHVLTKASDISEIAMFTAKGIKLALSNPNFRKELSNYLVVQWSKRKRGISVKSLYINPILASFEPLLMRLGIGLQLEVNLEKKRWESASGIVIICADGDLTKYWFDTGRAYLNICLAIESLGLSQATSAAIVEATNYHDDIEELIGTNQRILSVIRIGKGVEKRNHSPRLESLDMLTLN
jgi:hypothetical protein